MDEFGVNVYPVHAGTEQTPQSERSKRKVRIFLWSDNLCQYGAVRLSSSSVCSKSAIILP